jgi:hypothetical protein
MGLSFAVLIAIAAFVLRAQPGAPKVARQMPFAFVVLESWCFFAWLYGDKLRGDNVDAVLANVSDMQASYDRGLLICHASTIVAVAGVLVAVAILIYGARVVSLRRNTRA